MPQFSGSKNKHIKLASYFQAGFLLDSFFHPEDGGDRFLRNVGFTFNGLRGVISHIIAFITIAVRTANFTRIYLHPSLKIQ
jgi:hypothetical protein